MKSVSAGLPTVPPGAPLPPIALQFFYREGIPSPMAGTAVVTEWRTVPGPTPCPGCARGAIPTGGRALVFRRGPRGTERLIGQSFHGFPCLRRRAEEYAWDDPGDGRRSEAYREVERWAADQERRRHLPPP